jgi:NADH dehydrogenase [ubiquinone] 1 alpha subcomplex assembly factor 7
VNALGERLVKLIETQGPLSVAQFMTIALMDPQAGYYATRDPFGPCGDFVTAPEISQMFGELVGLWCVQCWIDQEKPKHAQLVELGPGRGTLMADALRAAKIAPDFLKSIEVVFVEASPALRAMQQERLKDCGVAIAWKDRFEAPNRPLYLVANEFFDALPVRQFVHTERGWCERMVIADKGGLAFALSPVASNVAPEGDAPPGAIYETSPAALAVAEDIAHAIARHGGAALIIDYGYERPGFGETLQAVGRHQFKGLLDTPGEIDLSAHVDFAGLAAAARRGGAQTYGPIGQGELLERLGIGARAAKLSRLNKKEASLVTDAVDRLTGREQMGTLFKALAILPPRTPTPPGF